MATILHVYGSMFMYVSVHLHVGCELVQTFKVLFQMIGLKISIFILLS